MKPQIAHKRFSPRILPVLALVLAACNSVKDKAPAGPSIATVVSTLSGEAVGNVLADFKKSNSSMAGQKLALLVNSPQNIEMQVVEMVTVFKDIPLLGRVPVQEEQVRTAVVKLNVDVPAHVRRGVEPALRRESAYVLADESLRAILRSMGIANPQDLLVPETMDAFKAKIRAEAGQAPLDGVLIANHVVTPLPESLVLEHSVDIKYIDIRPTAALPITGMSTTARVSAKGQFQIVDGPVVAGTSGPSSPMPGGPVPSPAPISGGGGGDPEGDTLATAREVQIGAVCNSDIGRRGDANDYFRISSPVDGYVTIELRNNNPAKAGGYIEWAIVDSGDKLLQRGGAHAGNSDSQMISVSAGSTYYVKVASDNRVELRIEYAFSTTFSRN